MKLRVLSDLHLEFCDFVIPPLPDDPNTVLVLAGDIAPFAKPLLLRPFLQKAASQFKTVCYVPGNHEFYHGKWPDALKIAQSWGIVNVHIMDRARVDIDGVAFLGATLWTDMGRGDPVIIQNAEWSISDFSDIYATPRQGSKSKTLTAVHTIEDHNVSRKWLDIELAAVRSENKKAVVITHHGISPKSIHDKYDGNPLNGAFISDLSPVLLKHKPELVIHGHTHSSFDYRLDGAQGPRVVVNPRGYARYPGTQENKEFDPLLCVEV